MYEKLMVIGGCLFVAFLAIAAISSVLVGARAEQTSIDPKAPTNPLDDPRFIINRPPVSPHGFGTCCTCGKDPDERHSHPAQIIQFPIYAQEVVNEHTRAHSINDVTNGSSVQPTESSAGSSGDEVGLHDGRSYGFDHGSSASTSSAQPESYYGSDVSFSSSGGQDPSSSSFSD